MVRRLEATTTPWARASGPAAVVYLSMKRVGVQMPAPLVMLFVEDGSTNLRSVNLYNEAPEKVRVFVCRACELWQFAKLAASRTATPLEGLNDQVLWQPPLAELKNEAGGVSAIEAAVYRACLKIQPRPKGRKAFELCDLCGEGVDSLEHRNWECARTVGFRADVIEQFPNRYRTMMQRGNRLFLDLGLVTGSFRVLQTHPEVQETWVPTRRRFSGGVYIDGSAQFPAVPFLRRCGNAVVSLDDRLDWSVQHLPAFSLAACAVCGPLKRLFHTAPASDPPLQVGHGCKVVGDTWRGGSGAGTSAKPPLADLWRKIWAEVDQPRWKGQFSMFKLKSNMPCDCSWTCQRKRDWVGNEVADLAAKRALEAWRSDAKYADHYDGWVKFARAVATNVAKSQSSCLQNLPPGANDVRARETAHVLQPPRREPPQPRLVLVAPHNAHALSHLIL